LARQLRWPGRAMACPATSDLPLEASRRRYRALVVDDERDFRYLMTVFLQRSGMPIDVQAVASGAEALLRVDDPPDLILLDIMMPDMDGFEVCTNLRADPRTRAIPILMLTALDEAADRTRGFLAGTDDYLAKPFDRREFLARVHRILQRTYGYQAGGPGPARRQAASS